MIKRVSFSVAAAPVSDLLHSDRPASAAGLLKMKICEQPMGISLPDSRRKKRKRANEDCQKLYSRATPKMSTSHKRKLNKLKEEKENQLQFSKSAEALEKCKIPESARALLQSSRNIGQVESKKVKRSKALIHSRATTHSDQPHKTKDEDHVSSESEPESEITQLMQDLDKNLQMKSLIVQKNTSTRLDSSMMLLCGTRFGMNGGSAPASPSKNDIRKKSLREDRDVLPTSSMDHDSESTNSMDKVEDSTKSSASWANGLSNLPAPSFLKDPKSRRHVSRPPEVVKARSDLPIIMMEQEIMEAINENSTVIIRGETGCGKTTQVPQFLYEVGIGSSGCPLGSGIVGVSQPRRIAVNATANRVAYELGVHVGEEVGYQVRYDKKIGKSCSIKFMTDGILLREIQGDILLKTYCVIILDEVHERSLRTDLLIGMLSRVISLRQKVYEDQQLYLQLGNSIDNEHRVFPLKLVLMSATMPVVDFISYRDLFPDPPKDINVLSRQFKVDIHFSRTTEADYINEAYKSVLEIHKNMPHGGILVFVTGYLEVEVLCQKLRRASRELSMKKKIGSCEIEGSELNFVGAINTKEHSEAFDCHSHSANHENDDVFSYTDEDQCEVDGDEFGSSYDTETGSELEIIGDNGDALCQDTPEIDGEVVQGLGENVSSASLKASFEALAGKSSSISTSACKEPISRTLDSCSNQSNHSRSWGKKDGVEDDSFPGSLRVLPLYSMLPAAAQHRVFEKVKVGERLVVVATNVAETSITIPGIKYVVDTGKVKSKEYNFSNGSETYRVQWISKASAIQRAGRAGRTGPGHCFRLYSSAAFNNIFDDCSPSEISKVPLDGLVLLLKSMGIELATFPFPTRPACDALVGGEHCLTVLEALNSDGGVTPLGKAMAYYPISPRHSKMLLTVIQILNKEKSYSRANLVLAHAVASAAASSLSNFFVSQFEDSHTENHVLDDGNSSAPVHSEANKQEMLIKRKKVRVSCEKFSSHSSDALSRAYALRHFELSKSQLQFCKDNALHLETMQEISELRKQLLKLVFYQTGVSGGEKEFSWIHGSLEDVECVWRTATNPLSLDEEDLLCRAICAGWADRVAKRIKGSNVRYQACLTNDTVFLDRQSSVSKFAPEYLVYSELIQTKKLYMHGVTCVKPEWLVECGQVLCSSSNCTAPYYDRASDKILYNVTPTFGCHSWKLPEHSLPVSNSELKGAVQAFAFALLDGKVLHCLRTVRDFMAERPCTVIMPEAANRERVQNLLAKLEEKKIDSLAMLRQLWKENPNELYLEIRCWFQKSFHKNFVDIWLDMLYEALVNLADAFDMQRVTQLGLLVERMRHRQLLESILPYLKPYEMMKILGLSMNACQVLVISSVDDIYDGNYALLCKNKKGCWCVIEDAGESSADVGALLEGKIIEKGKNKGEKDKEKIKDADKEKGDRKGVNEKEKLKCIEGRNLDGLLQRLPGCVTRDLIDQLTVEFGYLNSKANWKKLVRSVFNVPRTSLELLPYYSRMVATLSTCMKDISSMLLLCWSRSSFS